jgi:hypothetical protein
VGLNPDDTTDEDLRTGNLFINPREPKNFRPEYSRIITKGNELVVLNTDWAVGVGYFYLPNHDQIPENGLYRKGGYGLFLAYDGPFVAHYLEGTGYLGGYLEPVVVPDRVLQEQVECARWRSELGWLDKIYKKCL